MVKMFYAHSTESPDKSTWQPLVEHLEVVAKLAEKFAAIFGAGDWGQCAGLFHDSGKATEAFQQRLEGSKQKVDHSTFGARLAQESIRLSENFIYDVVAHYLVHDVVALNK